MSFFNKKEEVLEFQLTEHGKRLLEKGTLRPAFYAFYDEDVLYDTEAAGFKEKQNDADRRIRFDTPSLKVQKNTTSAETRVRQFQADISPLQDTDGPGAYVITENSVDFTDVFQSVPDAAAKFFLEADPLGTSDLKTKYAPAWNINLVENEIVTSEYYQVVSLTGTLDNLDGVVRNIPQINIDIDYKSFYSTDAQVYTELAYNEAEKIIQLSEGNDAGVALYLEENYLLLDIQERNTDSLKENFEIEVFIENPSESLSTGTGDYTKLEYMSEAQGLSDVTVDMVEYYMNVLTDSEVPLDVLRRNNIDLRLVRGNVARTQLTRDLYETDPEEPC